MVASLLLLFLAAPLAELVFAGGKQGIQALSSDAELRDALILTAATATMAQVRAHLEVTP